MTTFVDDNFTNWRRQEAIRGHVVIDGSSLCHHLYFGADWMHGGQYPEFRANVLEYFTTLRRSGVHPLVVLDGIDHTGEKNQVILRRRKEWINYIHRTVGNMRARPRVAIGQIIPMLAIEVFKDALLEMSIPQYTVDGEADYTIVEIANFFSCPVVSRDSDFFLFNVIGGYIPLDRFHWQQNPVMADVFHRSLFMKQFCLNEQRLCYLIPAVAGNDLIPPYQSGALVSHMSIVTSGARSRLLSVVRFASNFKSLDDLLFALPPQDRKTLETSCTKAQQMYEVAAVQDPEELLTTTIFKLPNGSAIPEWLLKQYRRGNLPPHVMESIVIGKCVLRVVVEDALQPSAIASSKELRQSMYALLGRETVTEFYRHGLELTGETNKRDFPTELRVPVLGSMRGISTEERAALVYRLLKCETQSLNKLEDRWRLVVSATVFWVCKCRPSVHLVKALVLCMLLCSTARGVLERFRRRNSISSEHRKSSNWITFLHAFAQWQCIYLDAMTLNVLLMEPHRHVSPALLYDGKVAMSLAFVKVTDELVSSFPIDRAVYTKLVETVLSHTSMARSKSGQVAKQKHKPKVISGHKRLESKFVHANPFALLADAEESDTDSD